MRSSGNGSLVMKRFLVLGAYKMIGNCVILINDIQQSKVVSVNYVVVVVCKGENESSLLIRV